MRCVFKSVAFFHSVLFPVAEFSLVVLFSSVQPIASIVALLTNSNMKDFLLFLMC